MRSLFQTTTDATGGSPLLVVLALLGLLLTACLSLAVAYVVVRGYRRNRNRGRLYLAAGLVLLTTGPILLQFVLATFTDVSSVVRAAAANASKLLGLGAVLYAIYGAERPREATPTNDADESNRVRR
ncbi:DUF7521 family protein [Haladaptatus salinisoli]|uniref:DUF7521 family protein n=1 Tax=Haladaptatus salinisoli TaxID=2884876 RepID=UPI001D0A89A0|nr:hypothetical protein [Haladaptatus salinisoli]